MKSDDRASSELAHEIMANADGLNAGEWFELGRRQGYLEGRMAGLEEPWFKVSIGNESPESLQPGDRETT